MKSEQGTGRVIKFRAWDGKQTIENWWRLEIENGRPYPIQKSLAAEVVMQFTGLHDKNGKEIYEGDVVEYDKDFQGKPFLHEDGYRFEIGFSCGSFLVLDPHDTGERGGFSGFYLHTPCLTVIGNIYENPELLPPLHHLGAGRV